jgi:hypothetical protein
MEFYSADIEMLMSGWNTLYYMLYYILHYIFSGPLKYPGAPARTTW